MSVAITGRVFDVQRYSLHNGPGIRTTVFLKGCPARCLWCHNPESQAFGPEVVRIESRCASCGTCAGVCPHGAPPPGSSLCGYYRFALFRNDRFEIGPTIGVGYLWLNARIEATGTVSGPGGSQSRSLDERASTGSITGAVGGFAQAWPAKRLTLYADYLYIKVSPEDSEASVSDWRAGANVYLGRHVGIGAQYKHYQYSYDRGVLASQLGGEVTYEGFQLFASFLF